MERDFLGLNWKNSSEIAKNKSRDTCNDSGERQWSCSNNTVQEDISRRKNVYDNLNSPAFLPVSSGYAFDSNNKPPLGLTKKKFNMLWKFPFMDSEKAPVGTSNTCLAAVAGGRLVSAPMNTHPLEGISVIDKQTSRSPTVDLNLMKGNTARPSEKPGQLTILYANAVNVYEDVSRQQAETIMHFAKNDSSVIANTTQVSKSAAKVIHCNQAWSPPLLGSPQYSTAATFMRGTVSQTRKATLERFLEKRKDRLSNGMPYNSMKKSSIYLGIQFDMNSFP